MPPSEKAKIVIEAKDKASKEMKSVRKEFGKLVGAIAAGNVAANLADKALGSLTAGFGQLVTATKVAARIQVLNRVVKLTGKAAGITSMELEDNKNAIINLGIAEQEALSIQQRFIQVQLDIGDAIKIARVAQDLAVIAGTNSSDTALQLTDALVKQRPILLKQFGIIADLNVIYGKQAEALGKTVEQLTGTEKRQAFLNEILEQAKTVAGAYSAAMLDVGKRLTSLPRHVQNAQNAIGQLFIPVLGAAVDGAADFLKMITAVGNALNQSLTKQVKGAARAVSEFKATQKQLLGLSTTYSELTTKTELTNIEQEELRRLTVEIAGIVPNAVTEWNKYGEAIAINTTTVEAFLKAQETLVRGQLIEAVGDLREEFEAIQKKGTISELVEQLQKLTDERNRLTTAVESGESLRLLGLGNVDELDSINFQISNMTARLGNAEAAQKRFTAVASTLYPELEKGTTRYNDALSLLGQELVDTIVEHQNLEAAQIEANKSGEDLVATTNANVIGLSEYVVGLETVDGKLQLVKKSFLDVADAFPDQDSESFQAPADYSKRWQVTAEEVQTAVDEYSSYTITASGKVMKAVVADIQRQGREHDKYRDQVKINVDEIMDKNMKAAVAMGGMAVSAAGRMTKAFLQGRKDMHEIFEGMAQDFLAFFVEQALLSLLNVFVPGLGTILGAVFDTPANDRMAMEQGRHFAQWFTRGGLDEMAGFPMQFAGAAAGNLASGGLSTLFPEGTGNGAGAGGGINITFNSPIMTQDFITDDVVDIIEKMSRDGVASIVLDDTNLTGKDDGAIL